MTIFGGLPGVYRTKTPRSLYLKGFNRLTNLLFKFSFDDQASADRVILVRWHRPAEPDPAVAAVLADRGEDGAKFLRACLRWLVEGCQAYLSDGLGVPDQAPLAIEPTGLAGWWREAIEGAAIVCGRGWTPFEVLFASATAWHEANAIDVPGTREVGSFLRCHAAIKRIGTGRVLHYGCTVLGHDGTR